MADQTEAKPPKAAKTEKTEKRLAAEAAGIAEDEVFDFARVEGAIVVVTIAGRKIRVDVATGERTVS